MTRTLLLAPAGVGLSDVVERLNGSTSSGGPHAALRELEVFYVEHDLLQNTNWRLPQFSLTRKTSMRDLLMGVTRRELMGVWRDALDRCVDRADASGSPHTVIAFHPSLYAFSRNEQYSTVGWALQSGRLEGIERVVLLIDDIYDMWERLAKDSHELFHHGEWLRRRLEAQKLDDLIDFSEDPVRPIDGLHDTFDGLVMDSAHAILGRLLSWRHLDMVESESLASTVQAPLTTLGVKHPFDALRKLVVEPSTTTAYLSHPISRPRRTRRGGEDWPRVVVESNDLSPKFAALDVVLVCPTAIDEFRLDPPANRSDVFTRPFALGERWPLLVPSNDAISARTVPSNRLTHIPLVSADNMAAIGATARSIETEIYAEVPFRDHYLVTHTSSFLVFRPLYEEGEFSNGVRAEITHWQQLARYEPGRRALFVHAVDDIQLVRDLLESLSPREKIRTRMRDFLKERELNEDSIEDLLSGRPVRSDMLAADTPSKAVIDQLISEAQSHAGRDLFFAALTALAPETWLDDDRVAVAVLLETAPSHNELEAYAQFLRGESPSAVSDHNFSAIESAIGMTMTEWVQHHLR